MQTQSASPADSEWIRGQLAEAGLPTEDLGDGASVEFIVATGADGQRLGAIGVEQHGSYGLLRSLVVVPDARGRGVGGHLVTALERRTRDLDLRELWLLTIDAERFFLARGFEIVARESVPAAIRATAEFSSLCPDTAHVMCKGLVSVEPRKPR